MAYAMLAWTHVFDAMNGWSDKPEQSLRDANDLTAKAISLQKALPSPTSWQVSPTGNGRST